MQLPKARYELEFNHGAIYGDEEIAALVEVLKASAPSCGPRVKEFEALAPKSPSFGSLAPSSTASYGDT